jgi:phytanoyl-CoA hydroxylase
VVLCRYLAFYTLTFSSTKNAMTDHKAALDRDGFLILPRFFSEARIDSFVAAVRSNVDARPPEVIVDLLDTNERKRLSSLTLEQVQTLRMKVNDLYLTMPDVRDLALDPQLGQILNDCMTMPVALCNSLYLEKGSAQDPHVDAIYMTPKTPGHLLASWVALEDVHEDAGPLEYFPGSHLIPQWKFSDGSYHSVPSEMDQWEAYMDSQVSERGLRKESFFAKKGDVFIWHAHLLHGGGPINDPRRTRRSTVFHYFTAADSRKFGFKLIAHDATYWVKRGHPPIPGEKPNVTTAIDGALQRVRRALS